jgi:hypothetical protein
MLVFGFTPHSSRGDGMRLPEHKPQPPTPQAGDDRLCGIEAGRDQQGVMSTLLIRQRYLMNYGGMQQAKSSRRILFRFSRDSLVFVCDLRARLF